MEFVQIAREYGLWVAGAAAMYWLAKLFMASGYRISVKVDVGPKS